MKRRYAAWRRLGSLLTFATLWQVGSCYRVEIDFTSLGGGGASGLAGAGQSSVGPGGESSTGPGGQSEGPASSAGENVGEHGGDVGALPSAGGARAREDAAGGAGGQREDRGAAGEGGARGSWIPINAGGECQDPPLSARHEVCHLTGIKPELKECALQELPPTGWQGCYAGGCAVCTLHGELPGYPYYFDWHPCCIQNDACSNHAAFYCNELCPPPNEHDKVAPCGKLDPSPR